MDLHVRSMSAKHDQIDNYISNYILLRGIILLLYYKWDVDVVVSLRIC